MSGREAPQQHARGAGLRPDFGRSLDLTTDVITVPGVGTFKARKAGSRIYIGPLSSTTRPDLRAGQTVVLEDGSRFDILDVHYNRNTGITTLTV